MTHRYRGDIAVSITIVWVPDSCVLSRYDGGTKQCSSQVCVSSLVWRPTYICRLQKQLTTLQNRATTLTALADAEAAAATRFAAKAEDHVNAASCPSLAAQEQLDQVRLQYRDSLHEPALLLGT